MTLIDDTCDGCGGRFDPMGDPLLTKHPEIGPYAVFCEVCESRVSGDHRPAEVQVAEAQWNALQMARKADAAERRAEEAEFHVEQLRDACDRAERRIERAERLIDSWEHDASGHSNPVFIGRLRETLRRNPAPVRLRTPQTAEGVGTGAGEGATGQDTGTAWVTRSADYPEAPAQAHPLGSDGSDGSECPGLCGEHHWLDRPESDTRECLICGEDR